MELNQTKDRRQFVFSTKSGPMGITLTREEVAIVVKMHEIYPEKYQGFEGVVEALNDYKRLLQN